MYLLASFVAHTVKILPAMQETPDPIPGSGRPPGEENDNPLRYSCLENPMDRGALWLTILGVATVGDTTEQLSRSKHDSWRHPVDPMGNCIHLDESHRTTSNFLHYVERS